jgi:hypothetical protein
MVFMKSTIHHIANHIRDTTKVIADLSNGMPDDSGIRGAEAVIHLRNAANELNHAHDCMQIALAQAADDQAPGGRAASAEKVKK